jgi:hypothetical protein
MSEGYKAMMRQNELDGADGEEGEEDDEEDGDEAASDALSGE